MRLLLTEGLAGEEKEKILSALAKQKLNREGSEVIESRSAHKRSSSSSNAETKEKASEASAAVNALVSPRVKVKVKRRKIASAYGTTPTKPSGEFQGDDPSLSPNEPEAPTPTASHRCFCISRHLSKEKRL